MRACACGLVRRAAWSMPGRRISSAYSARPVALSPASSRGGLVPTARPESPMRASGKLLRRLHDLDVTRAAAEVSRQRPADRLPARPRFAREQLGEGEHESRRAKAALDCAGIDERPLNRREVFLAGDAFDGSDRPLADVGGKREAGARQLPLHEHRTGAAHAVIAAALAPGEPEFVAQHVEQRRRGPSIYVALFPVDIHEITARRTARRTSSGSTRRRYAADARWSLGGSHFAANARPASSNA